MHRNARARMSVICLLTAGLMAFTSPAAANELKAYFDRGMAQLEAGRSEAGVRLVRQAARAGYADAQFEFAEMLAKGSHVAKDEPEAVKWYRRAAKQGHAVAQTRLGNALTFGKGTAKDRDEAAHWYEMAARQGFAEAVYRLGLAHEFGEGVKKDVARAIKLYRYAAKSEELFLPPYRLGKIYEEGRNGEADLRAAKAWYLIASDRGHPLSSLRLAHLWADSAETPSEKRKVLELFQAAKKAGVKDGLTAFRKYRAKLEEAGELSRLVNGDSFPLGGPVVEYKGRTLIGAPYKGVDNKVFFDTLKWAIDRIDTLPEELRSTAKLIKTVRYNPPSPERKRDDVFTNVMGLYLIPADDAYPAPMVVYRDLRSSSPQQLAQVLASNGYFAKIHKRTLRLEEQLWQHASGKKRLSQSDFEKIRREHRRMAAAASGKDAKTAVAQRCRINRYELDLMKAWQIDPIKIDRHVRFMWERGCRSDSLAQ